MSAPKLVVTGYDAICSQAHSAAELGTKLGSAPRVGRRKVFGMHECAAEMPAYLVEGLEPVEILGRKGLRTKDWATKMLLCCLHRGFSEALEHSDASLRPGLCLGTAFGSVASIGDFLSDSIENGVNSVNPQAFANTVINAPISNGNIRFGVKSLSATVSTGFNASLDAVVYMADFLRCGHASRAVVGGMDEVSYYELIGLQRTGLLSATPAARPFAVDADGVVPGEGCGLILLETADAAREAGRKPVAEIAAWCTAFDPELAAGERDAGTEVMAYVMSAACREAGLSPASLDLVVASAGGHPLLDRLEAEAIEEVVGTSAPVTAYKAKLGECFGASSALSTVCALLDLGDRRITGVGRDYQSRGTIDLVTEDRVGVDGEHVMINAFSCDGNCGSIILILSNK